MSAWLQVLLFFGAAVAAGVAVSLLRQVAPNWRLIDVPNQRSLHATPTPRGGGLGIALVCAVGLAVAAAMGLQPPWPMAAGYLVPAAAIVLAGAADDAFHLSVGLRLSAQLAAAVVASTVGVPVLLAALGAGWPALIVAAAAVIWTVGVTNAYNFMDGIDGLLASQTILGGLAWSVMAAAAGQAWLGAVALLVAATSVGFVIFNWPPAKIFLGDAGSSFLGFTFAFLAMVTPRSPLQILAAVLVMWPLLFDTTFTIGRRIISRENIFRAHRSHLYQRLVLAGWGRAQVSLLYAGFSAICIGLGLAVWFTTSPWAGAIALCVVGALSIALLGAVSSAERRGSVPSQLSV